MFIIKIEAQENGAHANQDGPVGSVPDGWALVPDGMAIPDTFPFVDIIVENGVVTGMTAGTVPETEPFTPFGAAEQDDRDALLIDHEYRLTLLELGLAE